MCNLRGEGSWRPILWLLDRINRETPTKRTRGHDLEVAESRTKSANIVEHCSPLNQGHNKREREGGRERGRERGRYTDRQTDRQPDRQTDIQTDRQTDRQTGRQTDRQTDRQAGRQTDRQIFR